MCVGSPGSHRERLLAHGGGGWRAGDRDGLQ